jgi:hypothetical protein
LKKGTSNWEFDVPPQNKPSDGKITLYASVKDAYLSGTVSLELGADYFPKATVQLRPLPSTVVRGIVTDEGGKSISSARVSIPGYPEVATTDEMGNFSLQSHYAEGRLMTIRAEKDDRVAEITVIAGPVAELVLRKR